MYRTYLVLEHRCEPEEHTLERHVLAWLTQVLLELQHHQVEQRSWLAGRVELLMSLDLNLAVERLLDEHVIEELQENIRLFCAWLHVSRLHLFLADHRVIQSIALLC